MQTKPTSSLRVLVVGLILVLGACSSGDDEAADDTFDLARAAFG